MTATFGEIDPRIAVAYSVMTTDIRGTLLREQLLATLSGGFGALAALLTIVGLYGVIAYTVTRRTSEIGVRLALGATRSDVAHVILRETTLLLVLGVCAGVVLALLGGRAAHALLFNVTSYDPLILAGGHRGDLPHRAGGQLRPCPARHAHRTRRRPPNGIDARLWSRLCLPWGLPPWGPGGLISIFYRFLEQNSPSGDPEWKIEI